MKLLHTLKHATLLSFLLLVLPCAQSQAAQTEGSYKSVSRYNLASQLTGSISPNPGGDNNASYIATRNTYDIYGRLTKTEI